MTIRRKLLVATATVGVVGALIAGANADDGNDRSTPDRLTSTPCRQSGGSGDPGSTRMAPDGAIRTVGPVSECA